MRLAERSRLLSSIDRNGCRFRSFAWILSLVLVRVFLGPAPASAQEVPSPSEEATARARTLFQEGLELADRGQWERAVPRFRSALELRDAAPVRYNLAASLARIGRLLEAIEELDRILADATVDEAVRQTARELRQELHPRLGALVVSVRGDAEDTQVTVDGRPWEPVGRTAPADPGVRVVRLLRGMQELDVEEIDVPEGGVTRVNLEAHAPIFGSQTGYESSEGSGASDEALVWGIVLGTVLALTGGAIAVGVFVSEQRPPHSTGDFMPPVLEIGP